MPFTPYHLGIALLLAVIFYKYLDMLTLLIGSVILDTWPFLVVFLNLPYHLHGFSHSFLIAFLWAILLIGVTIISERFSVVSWPKSK